jgi:C-terminal processing protease CtpA/Prc
VTVYEIRSPEGKQLNRVGVVPDEVIESDPTRIVGGDDPVLSRAIEILHDAALT